jgi:PHD/YefM family antitoxin component YafN of YafNO toxin-antitoxin module
MNIAMSVGETRAIRVNDLVRDCKKVLDEVAAGVRVIVARPHGKNVVVMDEKSYLEIERVRRNQEYLEKLERSEQQFARGEFVTFSMEELEAMAK